MYTASPCFNFTVGVSGLYPVYINMLIVECNCVNHKSIIFSYAVNENEDGNGERTWRSREIGSPLLCGVLFRSVADISGDIALCYF